MKLVLMIPVVVLLSISVLAEYWDDDPVIMWSYRNHYVSYDRLGHTNVEKTVEAMEDVGITGFVVGWFNDGSYQNVVDKAELFKDTDIKIWVASTGLCIIQSKTCMEVAENLSYLKEQYPNIQTYLLDDYHPLSQKKIDNGLTPAHMASVLSAKNAVNPDLNAIPTLYMHDEIEVFTNPIWKDSFVDGTTMWYWESFQAGRNPSFTEFKEYLDECNEVIDVPLISGFYVLRGGEFVDTRNLDDLFHDPQELYDIAKYSKENSDGMGLFHFPLFAYDMEGFKQTACFQQSLNDNAQYDYMLESKYGVEYSWYQQFKTTISSAGTKNLRINFDIYDSSPCSATGYEFKQLLVNGDVIWEEDICTTPNARQTVDETISVNGNADIEIRQFANEGNTIFTKVYFTEPAVHLNSNLQNLEWVFESGLTHEQEFIDTYNAVRSAIQGSSPPVSECGNSICNTGECSTCRTDCTIAECNNDGTCRDGYQDGSEDCTNSHDCICNRLRYQAKKISMTPVIDGDLQEYSDPIQISDQHGGQGRYFIAWDEAALYIAADVQDVHLNAVSDSRDGRQWLDDSIEMMFDIENDAGDIDTDDYKVFLNLLDYTKEDRGTSSGTITGIWNPEIDTVVVLHGTLNEPGSDTGYILEMRIPWSEWGIITPTAGDVWGFDLILNNRDGIGSSNYKAWSNSDSGTNNNPDGWGELEFIVDGSHTNLIQVFVDWKAGRLTMFELFTAMNRWMLGQ